MKCFYHRTDHSCYNEHIEIDHQKERHGLKIIVDTSERENSIFLSLVCSL
jgi:hypothetical protein